MSVSGVVNIRGREYKTVALRVHEFREAHPASDGWAIVTEPHSIGEHLVCMRAAIVNPAGVVVATGYAEEDRRAGKINKTSALENCETSAIGRALAAFGLGGSEYASADEVLRAMGQQGEQPRTHRAPSTAEQKARYLKAGGVTRDNAADVIGYLAAQFDLDPADGDAAKVAALEAFDSRYEIHNLSDAAAEWAARKDADR